MSLVLIFLSGHFRVVTNIHATKDRSFRILTKFYFLKDLKFIFALNLSYQIRVTGAL